MLEDKKITFWILEYCYDTANREFSDTKKIEDEVSRDFIQGVLDQQENKGSQDKVSQCLYHAIVLLCKLADGDDSNIEYEEDTELTALESAIQRLDDLATSLGPQVDLDVFRIQIKQQAVFVCARNGDFPKADLVFRRLFGGRMGPGQKEVKQRVQDVIKAQDPAHPDLSLYSYDNFHTHMCDMLRVIKAELKLQAPKLWQIAEKECLEEEQKEDTRQKCWTEINVQVKGGTIHELMEEHGITSPRLSQRSGKIWRKRKAAIQEKKEEILSRMEQVLEPQDEDVLKNAGGDAQVTTSNRLQQMTTTTSSEENPVNGNPGTSTPKHTRKRNRRDKESPESMFDETASDINTPPRKLPSHLSPAPRLRQSLAPAAAGDRGNMSLPPRSRLLNVSTISSHGGAASSSIWGRVRRKWEPYEEELLWEGVQEIGVGHWTAIKTMQGMPLRSAVDIKDKWRNIFKDKSRFHTLTLKLGPISHRNLGK